jgi:hypothetical protein
LVRLCSLTSAVTWIGAEGNDNEPKKDAEEATSDNALLRCQIYLPLTATKAVSLYTIAFADCLAILVCGIRATEVPVKNFVNPRWLHLYGKNVAVASPGRSLTTARR